MAMIENGKNQRKFLFACQDNLSSLWLLLHHFQKFTFSVKTIRLCDFNNIVFKCFKFGDRFQRLSFSVKTMIVFDCFHADAR